MLAWGASNVLVCCDRFESDCHRASWLSNMEDKQEAEGMKRKAATWLLIFLIALLVALPACTCHRVGDRVETDCWGDIIPCANATYDLGSPWLYWDDLYAVNCHCVSLSGNFTDAVCATFVVATSNTLDTTRADYVGDGVADDVEINAAIAALPALGGRVILLEGDYVTAANIVLPADTTLEGQGRSTEITANGNAVTNAIVINGSGVCIRDLKVTIGAGCGTAGARPNAVYAVGQNRLLLENLCLYGDKTVGSDGSVARQNGIFFSNVDYSRAINCEATNNQYYGIRLASGSDYNNIEHGIYTGNSKDGLVLDTSDNNKVLSCICNSNTEYGLHLKSADNNLVEGCTCASNTRSGIYTLAASENNYVDNSLKDNGYHGLELLGGTYSIVDGNSAIGNDSGASGLYSGLYVSANNTTIVGNICYDNGLHGIRVYRASHCVVGSNVCGGQVAGDGIHIFGDGTRNADYNTVVANQCYFNGDDGLEIAGGTDCNYTVVDGNYLLDNTGTQYVDGGNQSEYWGGNTNAYLELRPQIDFTTVSAHGKPTLVAIGVFKGFSLPIWNAGANVNEELYFEICVPNRWEGETDIGVHIDCCISQVEDNKNFNLQLEWEHYTLDMDVIPATMNTLTNETNTGAAAAQYQSYRVVFTVDYDIDPGDDILGDDNVGFRLRQIAASANQTGGEIIVNHLGVVFERDKAGMPVP